MISKGKSSVTFNDIKHISDSELVERYLGVTNIPTVINSPIRTDNRPSFALYSPNNIDINYRDFSTGDKGRIHKLLSIMWGMTYSDVFKKIYEDFANNISNANLKRHCKCKIHKVPIDLKCKIREWKDYDVEYWTSYGVSLDWLKYANVYPISHKIITKNGIDYVFGADKYAYAYVEFKDNKTTLKIYQPFNKQGFKWSNSHDKSVISLWTKVPYKGDNICICSSLKDALCLWANTGIPSISLQGEGYEMSDTAIKSLKERYKNIYILFDNDIVGLKDAEALSKQTGFINLVLPKIHNAKDISDLYKALENKEKFKEILLNLFLSWKQEK